jgi:hypothetical protein
MIYNKKKNQFIYVRLMVQDLHLIEIKKIIIFEVFV